MLNIILFGPPGSGKGTQAANLVEKYNLLHISTGDLFRSEIGHGTELGLRAKSYMDRGELVPDQVTIDMLRKKVKDNPDVGGYIFDGFPRTVPQAEALDGLMADMDQEISGLVALTVDEEEIVDRLKKRAEISGRSDDADEDIIRNRFKVYLDNTAVVADYYSKFGKTTIVNGMGSIDEIFDRLSAVVDQLIPGVSEKE